MLTVGHCRTTSCRDARIIFISLYTLCKDAAPEERPLAGKTKEAISHIRACEFCSVWFKESCCQYVKSKYPNYQYPQPEAENIYTLDRLHYKMHEALGIKLVMSEHRKS